MEAPQPLLDDIAAGRCLPFIGAGFSLNATLPPDRTMPDWSGLTTQLAATAGVSINLGGPEVAAHYERKFGRVGLIEAIRKALHADVARPGAAHLALARLPFDTIYTTNFDLLLEQGWEQNQKPYRKPYRSLVGELQMPFHGGNLTTNIIKMHGDIRHEEHIIVTAKDYECFLETYPVIATHLSAMLITKTGFFIGYSRTDPDFRHIHTVVRSRLGRFQRMSYIIEFNASNEDIERSLDDQLHILNIELAPNETRDDALAEFFEDILKRIDVTTGEKLRNSAPDVFEPLERSALQRTYESSEAPRLFESSSTLCFVLMPFSPNFDVVYRQLIKPAAERSGVIALRADDLHVPGSIYEQVRVSIQQARVCIADVSNSNPNVLYEIGSAQALGKPIVLIAERGSELPFNIAQQRVIFYDLTDLDKAIIATEAALRAVLQQGRLETAARLIDAGAYRGAIAELGVIMESVLTQMLGQLDSDNHTGLRPASTAIMGKQLAAAGLLNDHDLELIRSFTTIRNSAVHELKEPTKDQAQVALDIVREFAKRRDIDL